MYLLVNEPIKSTWIHYRKIPFIILAVKNLYEKYFRDSKIERHFLRSDTGKSPSILKGTPKTTHKSIAKLRSMKHPTLLLLPPFPLSNLLPPHLPPNYRSPLNRGLQWQFNKAQRPIVANVARYKPIGLTLFPSLSISTEFVYVHLTLTYSLRILDSIAIDFFIPIFFCFAFR